MSRRTAVRSAGPEDKATIANLIQLYLYDMTTDLPFPIGRDGRFEYDFLDRFWRHPYLILQGDELAGFALVIDHSPVTATPETCFMAEFFVLKAYRGRQAGTLAFHEIVRRHPGPWQVGVIEKNAGASVFWRKATQPYKPASYPHHFDGEDWRIYDFVPAEQRP